MFFKRTHRYLSSLPKDVFKKQLNGNHVKIHDLDFEVLEKGHALSIIPHAERVDSIKTLPITHVDIKAEGNKTKVVITSKMRKIDSGGPQLVLIFCAFMFAASFILFYVGGEKMITYTLLGISSLTFIIFYVRMQMGYFDYVRKINTYIKSKLEVSDTSLGMN
jgi:hypothetical protein